MKIATFNTNSIRARLSTIMDWLAREEPDVLCLQETKVQDKDFPVASFESVGYGAVFNGQKSYNGVAIITKHPLKDIRLGLYPGEEEARLISASVQEIPIVNVYVPQGLAVGSEKFVYKLRWLKDLLSHIKEFYVQERPLLMAGDFNVALESQDVYDPEAFEGQVGFHPDERVIMRDFLAWGFVDLFRKHHPEGKHYTFWDYRIPNAFKRKMGWRIDYLLATRPLAEQSSKIWIDTEARMLEKPSDHTFLVAEFR